MKTFIYFLMAGIMLSGCMKFTVVNDKTEDPKKNIEFDVVIGNEMKGYILDVNTLELHYPASSKSDTTIVIYGNNTKLKINAGESTTATIYFTDTVVVAPWDMKSYPNENRQGYAVLSCDIYTVNNSDVKIIEKTIPIYIPVKINTTSELRQIDIIMNEKCQWKYIKDSKIEDVFTAISFNAKIEAW